MNELIGVWAGWGPTSIFGQMLNIKKRRNLLVRIVHNNSDYVWEGQNPLNDASFIDLIEVIWKT